MTKKPKTKPQTRTSLGRLLETALMKTMSVQEKGQQKSRKAQSQTVITRTAIKTVETESKLAPFLNFKIIGTVAGVSRCYGR